MYREWLNWHIAAFISRLETGGRLNKEWWCTVHWNRAPACFGTTRATHKVERKYCNCCRDSIILARIDSWNRLTQSLHILLRKEHRTHVKCWRRQQLWLSRKVVLVRRINIPALVQAWWWEEWEKSITVGGSKGRFLILWSPLTLSCYLSPLML